jgi:hypothetical protein
VGSREACEDVVKLILCRPREQQDELVAAEPSHQVARSQRCSPQSGEFDEQAVAGSVAAAVVGQLEVVKVDDRKRERLAWRSANARCRAAAMANPVRLSKPVRLSVCASARRRPLSLVRMATATQTIVEMVIQTDTVVGARANNRLNPSAVIMIAAWRRAALGRKKNAT